jgi:ribosomal-protein-alanine N-acetyltransferase
VSKIILQTPRLILREINLTDAKAMLELNSDPEVMKYTGDVSFSSIEETRTFIANYPDYKKSGFGRNAVLLKETGEFLGWCGLKKLKDKTVDIGYRFHKRNWNKGYATESARAIIGYGFNNYDLTEIIGNAAEDNIGSIRVFQKLGMELVSKREYDALGSAVLYQILKSKF